MRQVPREHLFWSGLFIGMVLVIILVSIFSLKAGVFDIYPYFYLLPIILIAYYYPRYAVYCTILLGWLFLGLVSIYGPADIRLYATSIAWFYIFVSIGIVISSYASQLRHERQYHAIFDHSQAGILTFERDSGRVIAVNPQATQILGYTEADLKNQRFSWLWTVEAEREEFMDRLAREQRVMDMTAALRKKDQSAVHAMITASLSPAGVVICSLVDISLRKAAEDALHQAQENLEQQVGERTIAYQQANEQLTAEISRREAVAQALRASEERYRALYRDNPAMFFTLSPDGMIRSVNQFGAGKLGYVSDELAGLSFEEIAHLSDRSALAELVTSCLLTPWQVHQAQIRARRRDGSLLWLDMSARAVGSPDDGAMVLAVCQDVTERKRAEEALQQATKKLNMLDFITFNDIQNTVFCLSGYLELEREQQSDAQVRAYLDSQASFVQRIEDSLRFTRDYQSLGIYPPTWQDVHQVFLFAISHLDPGSLTREIAVDNLHIFADPLLEKVFFNLVKNVIDHGQTATRFSLSYEKSDAGLTLVFADDGIGIPDDRKGIVFQRSAAGKEGMGLFLSREILEITGITIRESGVAGTGARFEIQVPKGGYRFTGKR